MREEGSCWRTRLVGLAVLRIAVGGDFLRLHLNEYGATGAPVRISKALAVIIPAELTGSRQMGSLSTRTSHRAWPAAPSGASTPYGQSAQAGKEIGHA